ncbi:hypothetical protein K501DRAFT_100363 [Backusella circina FSU 941]|nr:hypothetical protein K501DRAFT_100363 [Backusella circina FSU 941]
MDEDSAKRQVIELEHERSLAADAMYMMSKKIEKSKAFIIEQNNIIKSLEPKETYSEAIKALQTELKTREQEIMQLKKRAHEGALQARREQRLMMSAWYNVTQKHSVDLVKANK